MSERNGMRQYSSTGRRDNMRRIFVGNLPQDVRTRDLESIFYKFGRINFIDLKTRRGPPFAFVEFDDYRDAEEAVRNRDGKDFDGCRLRVEFPRGKERPSRFKNGSGSGSGRSGQPHRRSKFRVKVTGLPVSGSWQDLKDHMREFGEVCFADVYKGGEGVVEFVNYEDMRYAIKKLNNTKFKSHEGDSGYIKLREDIRSGDSRSRSRSPVARGGRSPSYSPRRRGSSHSRTPSPRSPKSSRRGGDRNRSSRPTKSKGGRSVSRSRSRSRSRSSSRSSHSEARASPGNSRDRSRSRSPHSDKSPAHSDRRSIRSSHSRSPSHAKSPNHTKERSRSRSVSSSRSIAADKSPAEPQRTPSKTPSRTPTPN